MKLTWWERDELEEHFRERPDVWLPHPKFRDAGNGWPCKPVIWLRIAKGTQNVLYAVSLEPAVEDLPYHHFNVGVKGVTATQTDALASVARLLDGFTSAQLREEIFAYLRDECRLSIVLSRMAAYNVARLAVRPDDTPERKTMRRETYLRWLNPNYTEVESLRLPFEEVAWQSPSSFMSATRS